MALLPYEPVQEIQVRLTILLPVLFTIPPRLTSWHFRYDHKPTDRPKDNPMEIPERNAIRGMQSRKNAHYIRIRGPNTTLYMKTTDSDRQLTNRQFHWSKSRHNFTETVKFTGHGKERYLQSIHCRTNCANYGTCRSPGHLGYQTRTYDGSEWFQKLCNSPEIPRYFWHGTGYNDRPAPQSP